MTAQLGYLPADLKHQSHHITAAAAATPTPRAPTSSNTTAPTAPRQLTTAASLQSNAYFPAEPVPMGANPSPLKLWHEDACPLHLELAKVDPCMASLVMSMLQLDPRDRVSAANALKHSFLAGASPALQVPLLGAEVAGGCMGSTSQQPEQATQKYMGSKPQLPDQARMRHIRSAPQQPDQATTGVLMSTISQLDQKMNATQTPAQPDQATVQPGMSLPVVNVSQFLFPELNTDRMQHLPLMALQHDKAILQQPNQASRHSALPLSQGPGQVATALVSTGPAGETRLEASLPAIPLLPSSVPSSQQPFQANHSLPNPTADALRSTMQLSNHTLKAESASEPTSQSPASSRGVLKGTGSEQAGTLSEPASQTAGPSRGTLGGKLGAGTSPEKAGMVSEPATQTPAPSIGVLQKWWGAKTSSEKAPGTAEALAGVALFVNSLTPVTQVSFPTCQH